MVQDSVSLKLPAGMRVAIGMPVYGPMIASMTAACLVDTVKRLTAMRIDVELLMQTALVELARDAIVADFLAGTCDKLLWIDSDMAWSAGDVVRLLTLGSQPGIDVVTVAYPMKSDAGLMVINRDLDRPAQWGDFGLLRVKGAGLGFTLVDRGVLAALAASKPRYHDALNRRDLAQIFRIDMVDGNLRTEDMAFFADIDALGFKVWLDPHVELGHIGTKVWRGRASDALVAAEAAE